MQITFMDLRLWQNKQGIKVNKMNTEQELEYFKVREINPGSLIMLDTVEVNHSGKSWIKCIGNSFAEYKLIPEMLMNGGINIAVWSAGERVAEILISEDYRPLIDLMTEKDIEILWDIPTAVLRWCYENPV